MSPLVLPPVVVGFGLLIVLRWIGAGMLFTPWAAIIAGAVVSLPLLVRTVRVAVEQIDPRLELAAATLGASRLRRWLTITLPLAWRGIVGGAVLAWARAMGEFGATIIVAGNMPGRTTTIPVAVWTKIQTPTGGSPLLLVVASMVLALAAVACSEWLVRRSPNSSAKS